MVLAINWHDFLATSTVVPPMLGISPSAWEEARVAMGKIQAAIVVAAILQRSSAISSAGGLEFIDGSALSNRWVRRRKT